MPACYQHAVLLCLQIVVIDQLRTYVEKKNSWFFLILLEVKQMLEVGLQRNISFLYFFKRTVEPKLGTNMSTTANLHCRENTFLRQLTTNKKEKKLQFWWTGVVEMECSPTVMSKQCHDCSKVLFPTWIETFLFVLSQLPWNTVNILNIKQTIYIPLALWCCHFQSQWLW